MDAIRHPMKMESKLFPATLFSLLLHGVVALLLICCIRESRLVPIHQTIISVDIRTLEPESGEKPPVVPAGLKTPEVKSLTEPRLPVKAAQQPQQKTESAPLPVPAPSPSQSTPAERSPSTPSGQAMSHSQPGFTSPPIAAGNPSRPDTANTAGRGTPQPGSATVDVKQEQAYLAALKEIIERSKEYPPVARKGGMEGTVRIRCALLRNGELKGAEILKPSGHTLLDNAALRAVRSAGRFPRVPPEIRGDTFSFVAPITFRLSAE